VFAFLPFLVVCRICAAEIDQETNENTNEKRAKYNNVQEKATKTAKQVPSGI
jgi:hypothetical protein